VSIGPGITVRDLSEHLVTDVVSFFGAVHVIPEEELQEMASDLVTLAILMVDARYDQIPIKDSDHDWAFIDKWKERRDASHTRHTD
jgi:hypothetical protein